MSSHQRDIKKRIVGSMFNSTPFHGSQIIVIEKNMMMKTKKSIHDHETLIESKVEKKHIK